MKRILNKFDGWWHALLMAGIAFPLYNVGARFSFENYSVNPLLYLCFGGLFSSIFLLMYSGKSHLALKSVKTVDTWIFSFLHLSALAFGTSAFAYVSSLQGSVLIRLASFICFAIALVMGQSSNKKEYFLSLFAVSGIIVMFMSLDIAQKDKAILTLVILGASICQALKHLLAEFHKTNIIANTPKEHAMVSGIISAVFSFILLIMLLVFSIYESYFEISIFRGTPKIEDFFSLSTLICSLLFSGTMIALATYGEIYASKKISAKYLAALLATMPIFVVIYESIFSLVLGNELPITKIDLVSTFMLVSGSVGIAYFAILKSRNSSETELREKYITSTEEEVLHASDLIKATMAFTHNDIAKASKLLGVNKNVLIDILALEYTDGYKLSKLSFNVINKNYYTNVSRKDNLTTIENRGCLEQEVKDLMYKKIRFNLVYIDLNKFKQTNDTFGHDAGDEVLKFVANAMKKSNPEGLNARNGGDEFIMLVFEDLNKTLRVFKEELSMKLNHNKHEIIVSAALGTAEYKQDDISFEELVKQADDNMYQNKRK